MNTDHGNLYKLVRGFRTAIEKTNPVDFVLPSFQHFPCGACGDVSLLLGEYLYQNGEGEFDYVLGYCLDQSHAWLDQGGLIVDITADQFEDQDDSIIITFNHSYHSKFISEFLHKARIHVYDSNTVWLLSHDYAVIRASIRAP